MVIEMTEKKRGIHIGKEKANYLLDAVCTLLEQNEKDDYSTITPFFEEQLKDLKVELRRKLYGYE